MGSRAPLTMSAAEEAEIRLADEKIGPVLYAVGASDRRVLLAEIDALRAALDAAEGRPAIATCGGCGWHRPSNTRKAPDLCAHRSYPGLAHALPPLGPSGAPPDGCPLRRVSP